MSNNLLNHIGYTARTGLAALALTFAGCAATNQCTKDTQRDPNDEHVDIVLYRVFYNSEGKQEDTVKIDYPKDKNCKTEVRDCKVPDPKDPAKTVNARCEDTICADGGYVVSTIYGTDIVIKATYKLPEVVLTRDPKTKQLVRTSPKDTKQE